jgi:threonine dehydrogenase-like Zn-dependent dehydrogenase
MQALILTGPRRASIEEVPAPDPAGGEVLVRVRACGLCASDLNAWHGVQGIEYPLEPGRPGHEVWGEVAAVGPGVDAVRIGQPVTGLMQCGLAEYAIGRVDELVPIDRPVLGEPLGCAANVVRRARIRPGDRVACVGFGYLAALIAQMGLAEQDWIAISRRQDSLALAQELGAEATYTFDSVPFHLWDSFPVVIEAAGVQQTLDYATWLTAHGGRLVVAGYHADGQRSVNMQTWNWKGIDVINAHERDPTVCVRGLRSGLAAVKEHRLDIDRLITHRWGLHQVTEGFTTLETRPPGFIKGVVEL